jgi:hypothetical protein
MLDSTAAAPSPRGTLTRALAGAPQPLGPSKAPNGVNFALYAKFAKKVRSGG